MKKKTKEIKKAHKPKKRNPQDATLRNIRALKKRVDDLESRHVALLTVLKFSADCFSERIILKHRHSRVKK